jgi:dTDP-4-dehydrorhamnose reductase
VYELAGKPRSSVMGVSTEEYFKGKAAAPRPLNSVLDLTKVKISGFKPRPAREVLEAYVTQLTPTE